MPRKHLDTNVELLTLALTWQLWTLSWIKSVFSRWLKDQQKYSKKCCSVSTCIFLKKYVLGWCAWSLKLLQVIVKRKHCVYRVSVLCARACLCLKAPECSCHGTSWVSIVLPGACSACSCSELPWARAEAEFSQQGKLHVVDRNINFISCLVLLWALKVTKEGRMHQCKLEFSFILCSVATYHCKSLDELWQKILNTGSDLCAKHSLLQSFVTHYVLIGLSVLA